MDNEVIINEYCESKGLKKSTRQNYKMQLNHYSKFQNKSLQALLDEADEDEENKIRWKKRRVKKRLEDYKNYLTSEMSLKSAQSYYTGVKMFYYHYDIELQTKPINKNNARIIDPILPEDLPTKEILKKAMSLANPTLKVLIPFIVSTGISKVDILKLSIQDFIDSTNEYHNETEIEEVLYTLSDIKEDIIPVFKFRRSKTNKYCVTFASPEATYELINYLLMRLKKTKLDLQDKLFKINSDYWTIRFAELNDTMKLGKAGAYNRLRGHMLRKVHASFLKKAGMDNFTVNVLQGKSNGSVDDSYFLEDTETLKNEYIKYMHGVMIYTDVKELNKYSPEYLRMKNENKKLREQQEQIQKDLSEIKSWWNL